MNMKFRNSTKLFAIIFCGIFIIILSIFSFVKPSKLLGSVYDINTIKNSIDKVKVGDTINIDINGYSNWKVIYIDKKNKTVDVVSKDNVENITLETQEDFENALDIFQEAANKYVDGKYSISARCVNRSDLDNFAFGEEFWNADNFNGSIAYTGGKINNYYKDIFSDDYYYLPYIRLRKSNANEYNVGNEYIQDINGIDKWFILNVYWDSLMLIPQDPIKFNFSDYPDIIENSNDVFNNLFNELRQSNTDVMEAGSAFQYYGYSFLNYNDNYNILNHYINNNIKYKILLGWFNYSSGYDYHSIQFEYARYNTDSRSFECCYYDNYKENISVTKGFRPVVTLKLDEANINGKNSDTNISIGDNVNYEALEYPNWVVLSIDDENNTAEIVSGGVVKNIILQGKEDFDSYEEILQSEVDKYKAGDNVISARALDYSDLANLNKIGDRVNAKYWINAKKQYNKKTVDETSSPYSENAIYNVGTMYYNIDNLTIDKNWIPLYISAGNKQDNNQLILSFYNGVGELSFTAGLRPVIKIKLDKIEKIEEDKKNTIKNNTIEREKNILKEQEKNSNYGITKYNEDNNNNNNNIDKKNTINNYYNQENEIDNNVNLVKYILIGLILLTIINIIQVFLSTIVFNKMNKK